jgi:hypothetical protein
MEGVKVTIEPLNEDNYHVWCVKMKSYLITKNLWKGVEDPRADSEVSKRALALITLHVADHLLGTLADAEDAKAAWDELEKTYKSKSLARRVQLKREMNSLKMRPDEGVTRFVARARDLYRDLRAAGQQMNEEELAWSVLTGLPSSFDTLVTILEVESEELTLEMMLPKLVVHEQRLGGGAKSEDVESDKAVAYAARGRKFGGTMGMGRDSNGERGKSGLQCYNCLEYGHAAKECEKPMKCKRCLKFGHGAAECRGELTCRECGETGHTAKECHRADSPRSERCAVAYSAVQRVGHAEAWLLDSGCDQHLTGNKALFKEFREISRGTDGGVTFGDGETLYAVGEGTVEMRCATPDGEQLVTLHDVKFVPGMPVNLFSVSKAVARGAEVAFNGNMGHVRQAGIIVMQAGLLDGVYVIEQIANLKKGLGEKREPVGSACSTVKGVVRSAAGYVARPRGRGPGGVIKTGGRSGTSNIVEPSSDAAKERGGARGPSRVSPLVSASAGATPEGEASAGVRKEGLSANKRSGQAAVGGEMAESRGAGVSKRGAQDASRGIRGMCGTSESAWWRSNGTKWGSGARIAGVEP